MYLIQQTQIAAVNWWWDYLDHLYATSKSDILITVRVEEQQTS